MALGYWLGCEVAVEQSGRWVVPVEYQRPDVGAGEAAHLDEPRFMFDASGCIWISLGSRCWWVELQCSLLFEWRLDDHRMRAGRFEYDWVSA